MAHEAVETARVIRALSVVNAGMDQWTHAYILSMSRSPPVAFLR